MKKQGSAYGLGIISIFLIFAVLCLTVFATLAVSSARADLRLSEKNADYVSDYYAATAECAEFVLQAEAVCSEGVLAAISPGVLESDRVRYDMTFTIDENSQLHAVFYITGGGCEYTTFEVTASENADESADTSSTTLNVWQP